MIFLWFFCRVRYFSDVSSDLSQKIMDETRTASVSPLLPADGNSNYLNNNNHHNKSSKTKAIDEEEVDGVREAAASVPGVINRNFRRSQSTTQQAPTRKNSNTSYPLMHLSSTKGRSTSIPSTPGQTFAGSPSFDNRLNDFLLDCNCDAATRMAVFNESFTYEDFVFGMQKDDLCRIGLKWVEIWNYFLLFLLNQKCITESVSKFVCGKPSSPIGIAFQQLPMNIQIVQQLRLLIFFKHDLLESSCRNPVPGRTATATTRTVHLRLSKGHVLNPTPVQLMSTPPHLPCPTTNPAMVVQAQPLTAQQMMASRNTFSFTPRHT